MKILMLVGYYLLGLTKSIATFFLSGGGVVFLALAFFAGFTAQVYSWYRSHITVICDYVGQLTQLVQTFSSSTSTSFTGLAEILVWASAADTLLSYLTVFTSVVLTLICFIFFGILSSALGIVLPFLAFKIAYFIKRQLVKFGE